MDQTETKAAENVTENTIEMAAENTAEAASKNVTENTAENAPVKMKDWTGWKGFLRDAVTVIVLAGLLMTFIKPTIIREHSMENTLENNDYLILSRQHYRLFGNELERGDIVVFRSSLTNGRGGRKNLVKRVIALPGETVSISGGGVYIDGVLLAEAYTKDGYTNSRMGEITVPDGMVFCMGDNRQNSMDSRDFGCIDQKTIIGKAVIRLFPFNKIGVLYKDLSY